ncbi:hypothetical protein AKJ09_10108 [Labilithrix luteola]|uniref:Uncharacterized protein n=1 Tax=Labilithrix luteola TaxID=1391654 RepID=A0A0K1QDD6_9BACT|nr:hypothetical protein AKJ09_10108 [Labilithrix luteola]
MKCHPVRREKQRVRRYSRFSCERFLCNLEIAAEVRRSLRSDC